MILMLSQVDTENRLRDEPDDTPPGQGEFAQLLRELAASR